jgi:hypothetical protein
MGQAVSILSGRIERWRWTNWILLGRPKHPGNGKVSLPGRKTNVTLPENTAAALLKALSDFYGFEVTASQPGLFELAYSPVEDKMAKRDVFLSLANMMRTLTLICMFYGLYLVGKFLFHLFYDGPWLLKDYYFMAGCILGYFIFKYG